MYVLLGVNDILFKKILRNAQTLCDGIQLYGLCSFRARGMMLDVRMDNEFGQMTVLHGIDLVLDYAQHVKSRKNRFRQVHLRNNVV